ncbi:WD40-repeat-containing domain protein [Mycena olivaceomarginata]|nr:WD40-repeat-containing domain protein [Mycena olivaceomarginata]
MDKTGGWRFAQAFGDKGGIEEITEADIISAVEFDTTGNFLATADKGGRVVLFERNPSKQRAVEYKFYTEFQSHEPEFDYLKSLEIEEKINKIRWLYKTIKLWKVFEKTLKVVSATNHYDRQTGRALPTPTARHHLRLPRSIEQDRIVAAVPRKVYANAHTYRIHSISVNSDQETYISADDLRINLWNLNVHDQSFNIVDIKPTNMEELTEVITTTSFHPTHSKAAIRMGDLREGAVVFFEDPPDPATTSFFSEITSSISDAQILARGALPNLKLWDVRSEARPLRAIPLGNLYGNDCIFDKQFLTGSYHNYFRVYDAEGENNVVLQADKAVLRTKKRGKVTPRSLLEAMQTEPQDFNKKIAHASWHPREATVAIAATNSLFVYSAA